MKRQWVSWPFLPALLVIALLIGCAGPAPTVEPPQPTPASGAPAAPAISPASPAAPERGAPGLGDSLYPGFGNGGYDIGHYTLDLNVSDAHTSALTAIATIEATAKQDLDAFNFDFVGFDIEEIAVNGRPAQFSRAGQELTITPATPLAAGQPFTTTVAYRGTPKAMRSVALPVLTGWVKYDGGSFVVSEPDGAANFYPVNDHPLDKASYTFRVTVPKPFEVAANGVLADTVEHGDTTSYVWEARDPMASYLTTVNIGDFDIETGQGPNGLPVRNYYGAGLDPAFRKPFARQPEMLALYSELFGPYPFDVYGSLVLNTDTGSALENQTLSIFGKEQVDPENASGAELVVAHEAAHQWFGDSVSLADWSDVWLNEGFATYAEGLWIEHEGGRAALDSWVSDQYDWVLRARDTMSPPGIPSSNDLFNAGVYVWGALVLHALRLEVGDEVFFKILRTYYDRFRGGNVRTSDFIAVAEELSRRDLTAFFDRWLYGETIPAIPALGLSPSGRD